MGCGIREKTSKQNNCGNNPKSDKTWLVSSLDLVLMIGNLNVWCQIHSKTESTESKNESK